MPGLGYAFFFLVYTTVGLCALSVYAAWLQTRGARVREDVEQVRVGRRPFLSSLPITVLLMVPVAAVFMVLPRRPESLRLVPQRLVNLGVQPVTGFSQTVSLGQIGRIQGNPSRVMHVKITDPKTGDPIRAPEVLLRGIVLDTYRPVKGRWVWRSSDAGKEWARLPRDAKNLRVLYKDSFPEFYHEAYKRIRCDVTLEPLRTHYLFTPFAVESLELPENRRLWGNVVHHHLWQEADSPRDRRRPAPLRYSVVARLFEAKPPAEAAGGRPDAEAQTPQPGADAAVLARYLVVHPDISPRIKEEVASILAAKKSRNDYDKAVAIRDYVSDSSAFAYTLNQEPTPGVEPVEDFLFALRRGHCEYFASAMVIMLRCAGVPARLVNGFKVSEWNPIGGYYIVRQAHAHSWVEAYLRPGGWRTFDPSVMRDAATPKPMFARRWYRNFYDAIETLWVRNVLNYDAERQKELFAVVSEWAARLTRPLRGDFAVNAGRSLNRALRFLVGVSAWMATRWLSAPLALVLAALIVAAAIKLIRAPRRVRRRRDPSFRAYDRMLRILKRRGFRRKPAQTPWEFRDALLDEGWPSPEAVTRITHSFCLARYREQTPTREEAGRLEHALRTVRETARAARKRA